MAISMTTYGVQNEENKKQIQKIRARFFIELHIIRRRILSRKRRRIPINVGCST